MKNFWSIAIDNETGLPIATCSVYVYINGGVVLATIYSDDGVTPEDNPLETDVYGRFNFYVVSGIYYLKFVKTGYDTWTSNPITIPDVVDVTSSDTVKNKFVSNKIIKDLQDGVYLDPSAASAYKQILLGSDNNVGIPKEILWLMKDTKYDKFFKKQVLMFDNVQCQLPMELIRHLMSGLKKTLP